MAIHLYPDLERKPLTSYINDRRLQPCAMQASNLLSMIPQLKVWEVQYKGQGYANTCWYVGLATKNEPFLLNFTLIPSNLNVEFRYSQYLPEQIFERLKWQNSSVRYADLKSYGIESIKDMIGKYLVNIESDFNNGLLKQGGKSFVEKMMLNTLKAIYPQIQIIANVRPDGLRSSKNRPLELDLYLPALKLAIEIQGPQHFREVYGSNDSLKKNDQDKKLWCTQQGIRFIWISWEGFNRDLLRLPYNQRIEGIRELLEGFLKSKYSFIWWKDSKEQHFE